MLLSSFITMCMDRPRRIMISTIEQVRMDIISRSSFSSIAFIQLQPLVSENITPIHQEIQCDMGKCKEENYPSP